MASAWFPSDLEFHVFWQECFNRMQSSAKRSDWNEPLLAEYMKKNLFNITSGYYRAPWQSGLGAVPLGFTTYATNAIERSHRLIKHLMDPNLYYISVAEVMVQAVNAVNTKIAAGFYDGLTQTISKVWPGLHNWPKKKWNAKDEQQGYHSDTEEKPSGRIDFNVILKHYKWYGPQKTYLSEPCSLTLSTGDRAIYLYVMPKYHLEYAWEKKEDMNAALKLAKAETQENVRDACIGKNWSLQCQEAYVFTLSFHRYLCYR